MTSALYADYVVIHTTLVYQRVSVVRPMGPYSRPGRLAEIDFRTSEGRYLLQVRRELAEHVGGAPNAAQRIIIDRAATLMLRIRLMDIAIAKDSFVSEKNTREYLAWTAALGRLMKQLTPAPKAKRSKSLSDIMADVHTGVPA